VSHLGGSRLTANCWRRRELIAPTGSGTFSQNLSSCLWGWVVGWGVGGGPGDIGGSAIEEAKGSYGHVKFEGV